MDEAFENLKKKGKNDVDSLIKWMKDSKVIDNTKALEDKARDLFKDAANKQSVELAKFKEVLSQLAVDQKKNLEDFTKTLAEEGPKLLQGAIGAISAGASALTDAISKK